MPSYLIILAGATGNLGGRIAAALRDDDVAVRALVRHGTDRASTRRLRDLGIEIGVSRSGCCGPGGCVPSTS